MFLILKGYFQSIELTLPKNRFDQHFGDFVLNVCENIIDQLSVNADAKLNTFDRRRPFGVKLKIEILSFTHSIFSPIFTRKDYAIQRMFQTKPLHSKPKKSFPMLPKKMVVRMLLVPVQLVLLLL